MPALSGIRLLTLALNVPGPVAVARLVAEGASAVKIEPPAGDPLRSYAPAWYEALHTGVTIDTIDMKGPHGRARLDAYLAETDVLVTSHRPSALHRLGLGVEAIAARFPALRRVDIVGDSRAPEHPGHDVTYQLDADLVADTLPRTLLADMAGAERAVTAILLALQSPPGTRRVVGLRDVVHDLAEPRRQHLMEAHGLLGGGIAAYGVYRARDGIVAVAALEPHFRTRLYEAIRLPVDAPLADAVAERTCAEWRDLATRHDLPIAVRPAPLTSVS